MPATEQVRDAPSSDGVGHALGRRFHLRGLLKAFEQLTESP